MSKLDINFNKTPVDDLCDDAQKHYLKISDAACHYNSLIPQAIETYRKIRKYYEELQKEYDEQPLWAHGFDIHTPSELGKLREFLDLNDNYNSRHAEKIEDVDEQLDEEMPEELSKFEDDALNKKKRKLPKIHGVKEKRFIP